MDLSQSILAALADDLSSLTPLRVQCRLQQESEEDCLQIGPDFKLYLYQDYAMVFLENQGLGGDCGFVVSKVYLSDPSINVAEQVARDLKRWTTEDDLDG